jgi:hypothetical protein
MADETPSRPVGRPRKAFKLVDGNVGEPARAEIDRTELAAKVASGIPYDLAKDGWIPVKAARAAQLPASVTLTHPYAYYLRWLDARVAAWCRRHRSN